MDTIGIVYGIIGFSNIQKNTVTGIIIGVMVLVVLAVPLISAGRRKASGEQAALPDRKDYIKHLWRDKACRESLFAMMCCIAAQFMCWTSIIRYTELSGIGDNAALWWYIGAVALFLYGRIIGTFLMRYLGSRHLLTLFAAGALVSSFGVIITEETGTLCCMMPVFLFMSIMFPTIYGATLGGTGKDIVPETVLPAVSVIGGAMILPFQEFITDLDRTAPGILEPISAANFSFIIPMLCFLMVAAHGLKALRTQKEPMADTRHKETREIRQYTARREYGIITPAPYRR